MRNMGSNVYALFGGDVTQDGSIDASDMAAIDNDASHFLFGYHDSDCDGNGPTDIVDMSIVDNNTQLQIFKDTPY